MFFFALFESVRTFWCSSPNVFTQVPVPGIGCMPCPCCRCCRVARWHDRWQRRRWRRPWKPHIEVASIGVSVGSWWQLVITFNIWMIMYASFCECDLPNVQKSFWISGLKGEDVSSRFMNCTAEVTTVQPAGSGSNLFVQVTRCSPSRSCRCGSCVWSWRTPPWPAVIAI